MLNDKVHVTNEWSLNLILFQSSQSDWQKVEYLLEFAEWLYCNELRLDDCRDQLEWAIDILMNIKTETEQGQG